jgi:PilZ domain
VSTSAQQFTDSAQVHERRLHPRVLPKSLIYVACGESNGGMVLNASDSGLAISMAIAVGDGSLSNLHVRMNGLPKSIEVCGRMVWTTKSKKRAGIQLIDITDSQREQIREWIALDGVRDVNLLPRVIVNDADSTSATVVTAGAIGPMAFAEPRSTLLDAFGGSAPESLGPSLPERFSSENLAGEIGPSQGFDGLNPAGFRENEWDLAAVTMVPRKRPKPEGLSTFGLMLLWIAIPSFGIGILVGRRPLEQWLSRGDASGKNISQIAKGDSEPAIFPEQPPVAHDLDAKTVAPEPTLQTKVEPLAISPAEPQSAGASKPPDSETVDTKLLNSMSTQEARAFRSSRSLPAQEILNPNAASKINSSATQNFVSQGPISIASKADPLPKSAAATTPAYKPENSVPQGDTIAKNIKPSAISPAAVRHDENSNGQNFSQQNYGDHVSKTISVDTGLTAGAPRNPRATSTQSPSTPFAPSALIARGTSPAIPAPPTAQTPANSQAPANSMMSRQNTVASTSASLSASPVQQPSHSSALSSPAGISPSTAPSPGRSVASGSVTKTPPAPTSVSAAAPSGAVPFKATSSSASSFTSSPSPARSVAAGVAASLAPVSPQPPLHGVMLVARKNDESFLLKLPAESVPGGRSTSIQMQRFVMVPAQSRWHRRRPIAKLTVGDLLTQVSPEKPEAGVKPRTGDTVTVRAFVDKEGSVQDLKPVSGRFALMPRVMRAVRDWQFDQTLVDGKPVESEVNITVEFRPL